MMKKIWKYSCIITLCAFFIVFWTEKIIEESQKSRLQDNITSSALFREQHICEEMNSYLQTVEEPGEYVGLYWLETKFGYQEFPVKYDKNEFKKIKKRWEREKNFTKYIDMAQAIWNDVKYFPVPEFSSEKNMTVSYANSWMSQRTYGGERGHEGTDLIASKNERGLYPIVSMTDGVVTKKGWLDKGGYRIGIMSPQGVYFYYAHLESYADLKEGDEISAGDILGFMGDSGYGPEGTIGKFAVHLHVGIYIYPDGKEISINPYWVLRYIEKHKVKCYT